MELTCSAIRPSLRRSLPSPARMTLSMMAGTLVALLANLAVKGIAARVRTAGCLPPRQLAGTALSTAIVGESRVKASLAARRHGRRLSPRAANAGAGGGYPGGLATIIGSRRPQRRGPRTRGEQNAWHTRRVRAPWPALARKAALS